MGLFVCLLGPPAVGKSTLSGLLVRQGEVRVFRLREFARDLRSREPQAGELFASDDPLGWFSEGAVGYCLRRAFVDGQVPASGVVVLENLPGSRVQLSQLDTLASGGCMPLVLVELSAPDDVLRRRAGDRRVCSTCEPDPDGDPHRPALGQVGNPQVCASCGGELAARYSDHALRFAARLARFRERIDDIRAAAAARGRPFHTVDTTAGIDECVAELRAICRIHQSRHEVEGVLS